MTYAGFVLVGGRSSRMGRDKALLPYNSKTLLEHVAEQVLRAAGRVTLIGDPETYGRFGYPVVPDSVPDCGPLGGIHTALSLTQADWNLVVSCDLPMISIVELQRILEATDESAECVLPTLDNGSTQPVCAAYHRRSLWKIEKAISESRFKMMELAAELATITLPVSRPELFANINTLADWESFR
jgi:molybdopterin-guanine dinucleotide biosynthesis protein A